MKRKTRLEFFKKWDLMMNLVVKWGFWGGACGKKGGKWRENEKQLSGEIPEMSSRIVTLTCWSCSGKERKLSTTTWTAGFLSKIFSAVRSIS